MEFGGATRPYCSIANLIISATTQVILRIAIQANYNREVISYGKCDRENSSEVRYLFLWMAITCDHETLR